MKLSPKQRRVLDNLARGKPANYGIGCPNSPRGGFAWTMEALREKGLIDSDGALTEFGRSTTNPAA
jgi:hypothetical protein